MTKQIDKIRGMLRRVLSIISDVRDELEEVEEFICYDEQERTDQYYTFDRELEDAERNIDSMEHDLEHGRFGNRGCKQCKQRKCACLTSEEA